MQLTTSNKFQETVYDEKNDHICSVINLFDLHCRRLIKNCHAKKNIKQTKFKDLAYQRKFTLHFV